MLKSSGTKTHYYKSGHFAEFTLQCVLNLPWSRYSGNAILNFSVWLARLKYSDIIQ